MASFSPPDLLPPLSSEHSPCPVSCVVKERRGFGVCIGLTLGGLIFLFALFGMFHPLTRCWAVPIGGLMGGFIALSVSRFASNAPVFW